MRILLILLIAVFAINCKGGEEGGEESGEAAGEATGSAFEAGKIHARDIFFMKRSKGQSASVNITAGDITVDVSNSRLESTNLQEALNNEIAVDVISTLSSKSWIIENISSTNMWDGVAGTVTFTSDAGQCSITGMFGACGIGGNPYSALIGDVSIRMIENQFVVFTYMVEQLTGGADMQMIRVAQVMSQDKDKIVFLRTDNGVISILTKQE